MFFYLPMVQFHNPYSLFTISFFLITSSMVFFHCHIPFWGLKIPLVSYFSSLQWYKTNSLQISYHPSQSLKDSNGKKIISLQNPYHPFLKQAFSNGKFPVHGQISQACPIPTRKEIFPVCIDFSTCRHTFSLPYAVYFPAWAYHISAYWPFFANSSSWLPSSIIRPFSSIRIRSASLVVDKRWEI